VTDEPGRPTQPQPRSERRTRAAAHQPPQTIAVDGAAMIVLEPTEYERLAQARRQVGGYTSRMNVLKQQLRAVEAILDGISEVLLAHRPVHDPAEPAPDCPLCTIGTHLSGRPARTYPPAGPAANPAGE
jgi:hypothetical protein